jgi:hypothetical protein
MPKLALITRRKLPSLVNFLTAANKIKNNLLGEYAVQFGKTRSLDYKTPRCELYCAKLARCQAIIHYIPEISHEQKHPARRKKICIMGMSFGVTQSRTSLVSTLGARGMKGSWFHLNLV